MHRSGSPAPWELLSSERLHDYGKLAVRRDRFREPRRGEELDYEIVESPDGVTVLALTPEGSLVLVEQYRVAIRRLNLETPSGMLEPGEDPVEAGLRELRELREETGYTADGGSLIGTLVLNPAWETTRVHVVLVRGATGGAPLELDPGEDPRVRTVPVAEARSMVRDGTIDSSTVVAALSFLHLLEETG